MYLIQSGVNVHSWWLWRKINSWHLTPSKAISRSALPLHSNLLQLGTSSSVIIFAHTWRKLNLPVSHTWLPCWNCNLDNQTLLGRKVYLQILLDSTFTLIRHSADLKIFAVCLRSHTWTWWRIVYAHRSFLALNGTWTWMSSKLRICCAGILTISFYVSEIHWSPYLLAPQKLWLRKSNLPFRLQIIGLTFFMSCQKWNWCRQPTQYH